MRLFETKRALRAERDAELEKELKIRKNDPTRAAHGGVLYSRSDIRRLEEERVPWLRAKRRAH